MALRTCRRAATWSRARPRHHRHRARRLGLGGLTYGLTGLGTGGPPAAVAGSWSGWSRWWRSWSSSAGPAPAGAAVAVRDRDFQRANAVTLLIYGALGTVFLLLVLQLQTVAGFSPLAAGTALLPLTVVMLVFSARAGALAGRIGPRLPMTIGPLIAAAGLLLMLRIGPAHRGCSTSPAAAVFGAGMALVVAPLTAAVLDSAPQNMAGSASGVNNAVARAGGLLAVAVLPGPGRHQRRRLHRPCGFRRGISHRPHDLGRTDGGRLCSGRDRNPSPSSTGRPP